MTTLGDNEPIKKDKEWAKQHIEGSLISYDGAEGGWSPYAIEEAHSIIDEMDELDDGQLIVDKPEIPAFVAEEIEELKSDGYDLRGVLANLSSESRLKEGVDGHKMLCKLNDCVYEMSSIDTNMYIVDYHLTEDEIKGFDERYWAFKKEIGE